MFKKENKVYNRRKCIYYSATHNVPNYKTLAINII